jgi:hypothetical protein
MRRLSVLLFSCVACSGSGERVEFEDEGDVCLGSTQSDVTVLVAIRTCLSSSCDRLVSQSCFIERAENVLSIHNQAVVEYGSGSCTADCLVPNTRCGLQGLEPGEYQLRHGEKSATVTLPLAASLVPFSGDSVLVPCP